ncbi:hypothetical protein COT64_02985 [Candidatus Shapirobacteria bacterium CG09_land_8_20_14_0_10_39_12]|uniref:Uncharacterized protein n=1 Tax=Candidatus Shapirobacteria bacterium CG09_land_8_20_14_0_10_39_12 TaxID=1974885 RepID=A0A2H0WR14_9BACT|nr:MAG: hypothetical protein COT64_02985 [Candidatus Shapirobacteria bacterium CG09_land_8_20_14_0_10_39_12]
MPTDQTMEQEFEAVPPLENKVSLATKFRPKRRVVLTAAGLALAALVALLVLLFLTFQKPPETMLAPAAPSPTPAAPETNLRPASPYATDAAILKIEADLKNLDQDLQNTDLKEAGLNPPVLDMKVE